MVVRATGPAQLHGGRSRKTAIHLLIVWIAAIIYSARIFIDLLKPSAGADFELEHGDDSADHDDDDDDDEECILFIETDTDDVTRDTDDVIIIIIRIRIIRIKQD